MSKKALEALEIIKENHDEMVHILNNNSSETWSTKEREFNILEQALTPPIAQELVNVLNNEFKLEHYINGKWEYDGKHIKTKIYYEDGSFLNLNLEEVAIQEIIKFPKIWSMLCRFYEGVK